MPDKRKEYIREDLDRILASLPPQENARGDCQWRSACGTDAGRTSQAAAG